jgi:hypothetical protein
MWAMTISLKRPTTRLKKTDAIMISEAIPTLLVKDLVMDLLNSCFDIGLHNDIFVFNGKIFLYQQSRLRRKMPKIQNA